MLLAILAAAAEITITSASPEAVKVFLHARALHESAEYPGAQREFTRAVELDKNFPLAQSYLGLDTPGAAGVRICEEAEAHAAALPEAERLVIQANLARKQGNDERERALWRRIAEVAPGDWHPHFWLGRFAALEHRSQAALVELQKAIDLNPRVGLIYNQLGYVDADLGDFDHAIAALRKYSELSPGDPNPLDSLGEVQLWAGRLKDAEASFRKSTEIDKTFFMGYVGVAQCRFLQGDWAGGRKIAQAGRDAALRPAEKQQVDRYIAWSLLAEGKPQEALARIDAAEGEALAKKLPAQAALAAAQKARMLGETGDFKGALAQAQVALQRAEAPDLSGDDRNNVRRRALTVQLSAQAGAGDLAGAEATLLKVREEQRAAPSNSSLRSALHYAEGTVLLAKGDAAAAAEAFSRCQTSDYDCRYRQILALRKADPKAAGPVAQKLTAQPHRDNIYLDDDAMYLYVRSRLAAR